MPSAGTRYFKWLCDLVTTPPEYSTLMRYLHGVIFYPLVPNDDNRAVDGIQFRTQFLEEMGPSGPSSLSHLTDCTVLEMIIGLAYRLEFELLGGSYERPASSWFWVLINNLGFDWFTDDMLNVEGETDEFFFRLKSLLDRTYSPDGEGGLFPLSCAEKDQRRVEIWYQMSAWVIENYPI